MTAVEPGKLTTVSKLRVGVTVHAELMPSPRARCSNRIGGPSSRLLIGMRFP